MFGREVCRLSGEDTTVSRAIVGYRGGESVASMAEEGWYEVPEAAVFLFVLLLITGAAWASTAL